MTQFFSRSCTNNVVSCLMKLPRLPHSPVFLRADAHPELPGAGLHGAADHEAVARLEDVQRTGHAGEAHRAHEHRDLRPVIPRLWKNSRNDNGDYYETERYFTMLIIT